jgi:AraC-like DNA-binding protein
MDDPKNAIPQHLFTFAIRQEFPRLDSGWMTFPGHYLLYAATGAFHLDFENVRWYLPPQRAAWVAAETNIRIWADRPVTSRSVLFAGDVRSPELPPCRVFSPTPLVKELLAYVMRWDGCRETANPTAEPYFQTLSAQCNELAAQPERFWLPRTDDQALDAVTTHIHEHLDAGLTAASLAKQANLSERTLARRFQTVLGMTCGQYVHRARMLKGLELLETPKSVSEVAWAVGFESVSAFVSAFKTFAQDTPTQYRRRLAERS